MGFVGGDGSVLEVFDQEKSLYDHHRQISVSEGRKDVYTSENPLI